MHKFKNYMRRNTPIILTCLGGIGMISTVVLSVRATPKAIKILEKEREEKGYELTSFEKFRIAAPLYLAPTVVGISSMVCIFGACALNQRNQATLMSAYALVNSSYKEYREKLKELYGNEAHQNVVDAIAVEKSKDNYICAEHLGTVCDMSVENPDEPKLFYDEYAKRYFEATPMQVLTAEYHLNRNYILRGSATLNELYDFLGLELTDYGEIAGWAPLDEGMFWIDFAHRKVTMDDGLECYILEMPFAPEVGYDEDWIIP